jgi:hypothetical protein
MTEICVRVGVTEDMAIMTAIDTITPVEGYDAMRICLETIWRRYGKDAEQIEFVLEHVAIKADCIRNDGHSWRILQE